jgi:hypothetical protein
MTAHTMTRDPDPTGVELREHPENGLGQLLRHIGVHVVAIVVGRLGRVDVEAGAGAEVVGVVFAFDVEASCKVLELMYL